MGEIADQFGYTFRPYETDGVASSGLHQVNKSEAQALGALIEAALGAFGLGSLLSAKFDTLAAANAGGGSLDYDAGSVALIWADADDANNDLAIKSGASGAGAWVPSTIIHSIIAALAGPYVSLARAWASQDAGEVDAVNYPGLLSGKQYAALAAAAQAVINSILTIVNDGLRQMVFLDENGFAGMYIDNDGIHEPNYDVLKQQVAQLLPLLTRVIADTRDGTLSMQDAAGFAQWAIMPDKILHPEFELVKRKALAAAITQPSEELLAGIDLLAGIIHALLYGQSLSLALASTPPINTTAKLPWLKQFIGGIRTFQGAADYTAFYASLIDLRETSYTDGTNTWGETFATGAAMMIAQMLMDEQGIDIADLGLWMLVSAPGQGSTSVAGLSDPSTPWDRFTRDMDEGYARAAEAGRTYLPKAVFWAQGEQDEGLGTSQAAYVASARALQDDAAAHKLALTGDGSPFPFITYQNATHTQHAPYQPAIPLAHLQLAEEDADWALAVIMYIMDYTAGEHLTANSSRLAGAYYGLALYQWVFGKAKPWHLSPAAPVWGAKSIIIPFDHVVGALAFDTSRVSDPGNYGFTLVDNLGAAIAINTPVIVGNAVQITTATAIPSGSRLRYAWGAAGWAPGRSTGARGCLRDSQGDSIKFASGGNFPMHKYCPIFEKVKP